MSDNSQAFQDLEKLAKLRARGVITQAEFTTEKKQILENMNQPTAIQAPKKEAVAQLTADVKTEKVAAKTPRPIWYKRPIGLLLAVLMWLYFIPYWALTRNDSRDEWYQHGWGAAVAVVFLPFFALWHIWARKQHWAIWLRGALSAVIVLFMVSFAAASADPQPAANAPHPTAQKPAVVQDKKEVKELKETKPVAYGKQTVDDGGLPQGQTKITQAGSDGVETITYSVTYVNGKEMARKLVSDTVTQQPVVEVTAHGTYVAPAPQPQVTPTPAPVTSGARTGAVCKDGSPSSATGSGACSHHGGVAYWTY